MFDRSRQTCILIMRPLFSALSRTIPGLAMRSVIDRRIIQNASALYGAKIANYLLPLVMVPYLARVLGPEAWGVILFVQAIGMYLMLVVEYSFDLSATRQVARNQDNPALLARFRRRCSWRPSGPGGDLHHSSRDCSGSRSDTP
jgi:hypothetical protein